MSDWLPIESAPENASILMFGKLDPHHSERQLYGNLDRSFIASGYFDPIDDAWCVSGASWTGPWFIPTHWQPLPSPPP